MSVQMYKPSIETSNLNNNTTKSSLWSNQETTKDSTKKILTCCWWCWTKCSINQRWVKYYKDDKWKKRVFV